MMRQIILLLIFEITAHFYLFLTPAIGSETNIARLEEEARNGNAMAQNDLGVMYRKGNGVRQDYKKAREWFEEAAYQDNAIAQYNLGAMYENGHGVRQDIGEAKEWFGKSCDNGYQKGCDSYKRLNNR